MSLSGKSGTSSFLSDATPPSVTLQGFVWPAKKYQVGWDIFRHIFKISKDLAMLQGEELDNESFRKVQGHPVSCQMPLFSLLIVSICLVSKVEELWVGNQQGLAGKTWLAT